MVWHSLTNIAANCHSILVFQFFSSFKRLMTNILIIWVDTTSFFIKKTNDHTLKVLISCKRFGKLCAPLEKSCLNTSADVQKEVVLENKSNNRN